MPATMRQDRIIQASIFDLFSEHEIGRELKAMSERGWTGRDGLHRAAR